MGFAMQELLQVGVVTKTHGLAGEVRVYPTTDDPNRFKKLKEVLLETKSGMQTMQIEHVKFFKNLVILKFRGLDKIEDVEGFRDCGIFVTRENAVPLEEDEYFIADLIGMQVYQDSWDNPFGELTDVLQTGANDVYEVSLPDGRQVLIPAIHSCILQVDTEKNAMLIHLLKGLLE